MTPKDYSQLLLEVAHIWRKVTGQRHRAQEDAQRAFGYVLELARALRQLEIEDPHVFEIDALLQR